MTIKDFFNKSVVVFRMKAVTGNKRNFTTTATVDVAIQELDKNATRELDQVKDRAWQCYFDIEDENKIKEGDKIVDSYGIEYKVQEKTIKDYGINQHVDVILVEYSKS